MEKVNVAAASLDFMHHKYSAIRVKYFPDYEHIHLLQTCLIKQGIEFSRNVHMSEFALIKVDKSFVLEEMEEGIYFDKMEEHKGYVAIPRQITDNEFSDFLIKIRNNDDCGFFDAALGAMIIDSKVIDMIRIYSENLQVGLLKCVREWSLKSILRE